MKVIKSNADYEAALVEIARLLDRNPPSGTPDAEQLEVLTLLVRGYEDRVFSIPLPDPVDAIKFRMEQQNLSQRDLVPFFGSRSKVSEVLSGKRALTLSMIRALHSGLGIPAKVLLRERDATELEEAPIQWERFPIREMVARGWIKERVIDFRSQAEDVLRRFFAQMGSAKAAAPLYRQTENVRSARDMDRYALTAWTARVVILALQNPPPVSYAPGSVDLAFLTELARLSVFDQGPLLAREFLAKHGIALVLEPHLPRTYLDGAAIMTETGRPIVGMTLRYDRLDNFWFCVIHELAHVSLHLTREVTQFFDDLDVQPRGDRKEEEADRLAGEALIPEDEWRRSPASRLRSPEAAVDLAGNLRIHPAIVAGRIRHHFKSYRVLNQLVGHGQVRGLFAEVKWSKEADVRP